MDSGVMVAMTLNFVVDSSCAKFRDLPAIGMAMEEPLSYGALHEHILALAAHMQEEGVRKGDHIALLSENSHYWGIAYLACVRLGAIAVPVLPDLPESDVHHILSTMKPKLIFTTQKQVEKIYELRGGIKRPVITLDDFESELSVVPLQPFSAYLAEALGRWRAEEGDFTFPEVEEDDIATILYTSGTSGYSKAVMLTHKNLTANGYAAAGLKDIPPGSVWLSILPISHTYEFTCGFILPIICGGRIAYAGKTPTPAILQKLCSHEKPFVIFAVPLVLEKIFKKRVLPQIEQSPLLSRLCKIGMTRKFIYKMIGKKLLHFFGGKLQLMGVGGAALNPDVEQFFHEAGFPYLIGYGMTETAPLIAGGPADDKDIPVGSTGKPIPGVQVRIEDPHPENGIGEIAVCGPNVMLGYYNDPESTAKVMSEDGWIYTGDLGFMDEKGNLHVTGRCKNVIVLPNGENVYPEVIEHKINTYHWVAESLVKENNSQIEASIYPDYELIDEETSGMSLAERHDFIDNLLESMRIELNGQLPKTSRLAKVLERREPFIKTATHKIKRYLYHGFEQ